MTTQSTAGVDNVLAPLELGLAHPQLGSGILGKIYTVVDVLQSSKHKWRVFR